MKFLGSFFICLIVFSTPWVQGPKVDDAINFLKDFGPHTQQRQALSTYESFKIGTLSEKQEKAQLFPFLLDGVDATTKMHIQNLLDDMNTELRSSAGAPRGRIVVSKDARGRPRAGSPARAYPGALLPTRPESPKASAYHPPKPGFSLAAQYLPTTRGRMPQSGLPVRAVHGLTTPTTRDPDEAYAYRVAQEEASLAARSYASGPSPSPAFAKAAPRAHSPSPSYKPAPPPVFGKPSTPAYNTYSGAWSSDLDTREAQMKADEEFARSLVAAEPSPRPPERKVPVRGRSAGLGRKTTTSGTYPSATAYPVHMPRSSSGINKRAPDYFVYYFQDYVESTSKCAYTSYRLRTPWNNKDVVPLESIIGRPHPDRVSMTGGLSFSEAEDCHCWVQWAFPSQDSSEFNPEAPLSNAAIQRVFRSNPRLMNALKNSFKFYLNFMGFDLHESMSGVITFRERSDFSERIKNFLDHPHNFYRVSRIISSLMQHGLEKYGQAFAHHLTAILPTKNDQFARLTSQINPSAGMSAQSHWIEKATTTFDAPSKSRSPSPRRHLPEPDTSADEALALSLQAAEESGSDSRGDTGAGSSKGSRLARRSPSPEARTFDRPEVRPASRRVVTDDETRSRGRSGSGRTFGRSSSVSAIARPSYQERESRVAATRRAAVNTRIMANPRSFLVIPLPCAPQSGVDCGYHGSANGTTLAQHTHQRGTFEGVRFQTQATISQMKADFLSSGHLVDSETSSSALAYGNVEAFTRFLLTPTEERTIYQNTQNPLLYFTPLDYLQNTIECEKIADAQRLVTFIEANPTNFELIRRTVQTRYRNIRGDLVFPDSAGDDRLVDISGGRGITMAMLKDTLSLVTETKRSIERARARRFDLIHPKPFLDAIQAFRAGKKLILTWLIHSGRGIGHWICLGFEQADAGRINVYKINSSDSRGTYAELDDDAKRFIYDLQTFEIPNFEESASLRTLFAE